MVRFAIQQSIDIISGSVKALRRKKLPKPFFTTKAEAFEAAITINLDNLKILIQLRQDIKTSNILPGPKAILLMFLRRQLKRVNKQEGKTRTEHRKRTRDRKQNIGVLRTAAHRKQTARRKLSRAISA